MSSGVGERRWPSACLGVVGLGVGSLLWDSAASALAVLLANCCLEADCMALDETICRGGSNSGFVMRKGVVVLLRVGQGGKGKLMYCIMMSVIPSAMAVCVKMAKTKREESMATGWSRVRLLHKANIKERRVGHDVSPPHRARRCLP